MPRPRLRLGVAAAMAMALLAGRSAPAAEEIWLGAGASSVWSNPVNWLDGTSPAPEGSVSLTLHFLNVQALPATIVNDLPGTFTLNRLVLANTSSSLLSIEDGANRLRFAGVDPQIELRGAGPAQVNSPITLESPSGFVRITGSGQGNVTFAEGISEGATPQALVIATTQKSPGTQLVTLSTTNLITPGANSFTGGLILESGTAVATSSQAFGKGNIVFAGGTLRLTGAGQVTNPIQLRSAAEIETTSDTTISGAISSQTPGTGVTFRGSATATLSAASYTGTTTLALSRDAAHIGNGAPTVTLNGSSTLIGPIRVNSGGKLLISGAAAGAGRIGDETPVHLRGGILELAGNLGATVQSEAVGAIDGAGYSILSLSASSSPGTRIIAPTVSRTERGTFLFRGAKLGATPGAGVGNILLGAAPEGMVGGGGTGVNTSILPWAIGDAFGSTGAGSGFVTFNPTTGVRPLSTSTEYAASISGAAPTNNVRQTSASLNINTDRTINSLLLDGGQIGGTGRITVTSGAILQGSGAGITNPITFGAAEANIFTVADLALTGELSGTGGLTKSASGTLTLGQSNSITGQITVNSGSIAFPRGESFGSESSAIVIAGSGAGLRYIGLDPLTFERPIETRNGLAVLSAGFANLTVSGPISGPGGISVNSDTGKVLTLAANNTYEGMTRVSGGRVMIPNDTALGNGGALALTGGTLAMSGDWVTAREVYLGQGALDTGGFDATWNGIVRGVLRKTGEGTLTLTQPAMLSAIDSLTGGALVLSSEGMLPLASIPIGTGAELRLDNAVVAQGDRLLDSAVVMPEGGTLSLIAHGSQLVTERIGQIALGAGGANTVALTAPGTAGAILQLRDGFATAGRTAVLRVARLGDAAGTAFERIVVGNSAAVSDGLAKGLVADPGLTGSGTHFVVYDGTVDAAGPIGFRPLREAEITRGGVLQNQGNGGLTPTTAHFLAESAVTVEGVSNTINSLTLGPAGGVTLTAGQTVTVTSGRLLARTAGGQAAITGGTVNFGSLGGEIYAGADLHISSSLSGSGGITKSGPGTLTLAGVADYTGGTLVSEGVLKVGPGDPLSTQSIRVDRNAIFDVSSGSTSVGALTVSNLVLGSSTLTVGGLGTDSTFHGGITGSGQIVLLDGGNPSAGHFLSGSNSGFTGTLRLDSGRLHVAHPSAFGSGTLLVRGGFLATLGGATISSNIILEADLHIESGSRFDFGPGTAISGSHDVVLNGAVGLTVTAPIVFAGMLRSEAGAPDKLPLPPSTIVVTGATGSISAPAGVQITSEGMKLSLEYGSDYTGLANTRIDDATPVILRGGTLELASVIPRFGPTTTVNSVETVGPITGAGRAILSLNNNGASAQLTAASVNRSERGTFLFTSSSGSFGAQGVNVGQFKITAPPLLSGGGGAGADTSIIPWAAGTQLTGGAGFVTYGSNGIRLLAASEYATSLTNAAATNNVSIGSNGATNDASVTINSLAIGSAILRGIGTINISSGAVLVTGSGLSTTIWNNLSFGEREAIFHFPYASSNTLAVMGEISGTGGLTRSGTSTLTLGGINTFTGPITINGGKLAFDSLENLGRGLEPITLHGDTASLSYSGTESVALARDIHVQGNLSSLEANQGTLDVSNRISGVGGVRISGSSAVNLGTSNTYSGPTFLTGVALIGGDAALGGGGVFFGGGTLKLTAPWITNRVIDFKTSGGAIDTNGFDAVLSGPLLGTFEGTFTKKGLGTLLLENAQPFDAGLVITGGEVQLAKVGAARFKQVSLFSGGKLVLDNIATPTADRIPDAASLSLWGGELQIMGHPAQPLMESLGAVSVNGNAMSTITLVSSGEARVTLGLQGYQSGKSALLLRGDRLGGSTGPGDVRIVFATPPTSVNGVIPGVLADASATGNGSSFAVYDSSADAFGTIGIRPLANAEFSTGADIRNPRNGGGILQTANFRALGATAATGAFNEINSLRLSDNSALQLAADQTLVIGEPGILADAGTSTALIGGTVRLNGAGFFHVPGDLSLASRVSNHILTKSGSGLLTIQPGASFTGLLNLAAGSLRLSSSTSLQDATVNVGAAVNVEISNPAAAIRRLWGSGNVTIPTGTLTVGNLGSGVQISGAGGLTLVAGNILYASPGHSGPTTIVGDSSSGVPLASVEVTSNGSILNTSHLTVRGALLELENRTRSTPRIASVPVNLDNGLLNLRVHSVPVAQPFGLLTFRGGSSIIINRGSSLSALPLAEISFDGLAREKRGTMRFFTATIGDGANAFPVANAPTGDLVGAGTTQTNRPILPYAIQTDFNRTDYMVTLDPVLGIRALTADEYSPSLVAGDNVRISSAVTVAEPTTVNALITSHSITGGHEIGITSGLLIGTGDRSFEISSPVSFGAAEANVFVNSGTYMTLSGMISGSGGLTLTGGGVLRLQGTNAITGPLTLNSGRLEFKDIAQLSGATGEIILNSAQLTYSGEGDQSFSQPIRLMGAGAVIDMTSSSGNLRITQPVTGPGGLQITSRVILDVPAAYDGPTTISGPFTLASESILGTSSKLRLSDKSTLNLAASIQFSHEIEAQGVSTFNTAGFDTAFSRFTGSGTFQKVGTGRLIVSNGVAFTGTLEVRAGVLELAGNIGGRVSVSAGATIQGDGSFEYLAVGGLCDPGAGGTGTFHTDYFILGSPATLRITLDSASSFDRIISADRPSLGDGINFVLQLAQGFDPVDGVDQFTLLRNDSPYPIMVSSGAPLVIDGNSLGEGETFISGGQDWRISYVGGDGNDLTLFAVPEPTTGLLAFAGAALLGMRRRSGRRPQANGSEKNQSVASR